MPVTLYIDVDLAIFRTPEPETSPDRGALSLSRFYHGSGGRKTSGRSTASDAGAHRGKEDKRDKRDSKDSSGTKEKKDAMLLRKPTSPSSPGFTVVKTGQGILEQIGVPDHKGWMRKRGAHYNTWKNRYFVLKGPHMYWLRSNNASVRFVLSWVTRVVCSRSDLTGVKDQRLCQYWWLSNGRG
jgi:hypothetical protein